MSLIFIIGMPAAGKSYWAKKVAEKYHIGFIDLDTYIEQCEQASVTDLFARRGEDGFRTAEHEALKEIINNNAEHTIIACGGGTPCYNNNLYMMKQAGVVIYLKAAVELLLERLEAEIAKRPLLHGHADPETRLAQLLATREPVYMQANHILPAENISIITFDPIINPLVTKAGQ